MASSRDSERRRLALDPRKAFETDGIVRVPGVVGSEDVGAMRDCLWEMLAAHGLDRDDPSTWAPGGGLRLGELCGALRPGPGTYEVLWEVGRAAAFGPLEAALGRAADQVFGAGRWAPIEGLGGGLAAPCFPLPNPRWNVPHAAWHVDEPTAVGQPSGWGLLGFAFLDEVEPAGGATVVVAGSPRRLGVLAAELGSVVTTERAVAALTEEEPWFADLLSEGDPDDRRARFMTGGYISKGVSLRVVELTGKPGDITLMDPRCLHTVSANASRRARLTMRMTCGRVPGAGA